MIDIGREQKEEMEQRQEQGLMEEQHEQETDEADDRQTIHNALEVMEKTFDFALLIDAIEERYREQILERYGR